MWAFAVCIIYEGPRGEGFWITAHADAALLGGTPTQKAIHISGEVSSCTKQGWCRELSRGLAQQGTARGTAPSWEGGAVSSAVTAAELPPQDSAPTAPPERTAPPCGRGPRTTGAQRLRRGLRAAPIGPGPPPPGAHLLLPPAQPLAPLAAPLQLPDDVLALAQHLTLLGAPFRRRLPPDAGNLPGTHSASRRPGRAAGLRGAAPYLSPPVPLLLLLKDLGARRRLPLRAAEAAAGRHRPGSAPLPLSDSGRAAPLPLGERPSAASGPSHPAVRSGAPSRSGGPRRKEAPGRGV